MLRKWTLSSFSFTWFQNSQSSKPLSDIVLAEEQSSSRSNLEKPHELQASGMAAASVPPTENVIAEFNRSSDGATLDQPSCSSSPEVFVQTPQSLQDFKQVASWLLTISLVLPCVWVHSIALYERTNLPSFYLFESYISRTPGN